MFYDNNFHLLNTYAEPEMHVYYPPYKVRIITILI